MARGSSLLAFIITRLLLAVPMLLFLLTFVFVILRILPGDPVLALWGGRNPPPEVIEAARRQLGLDQPAFPNQYVSYLSNIFTGNWGTSFGEFYRGQSVWAVMMQKFPATVELAVGAMTVATILGVGSGILGGAHRDKAIDVGARLYGTIVWVIPIFWLGLLFQIVFGVWLRWLPPHSRWDGSDFPIGPTGMYTVDSLLARDPAKFLKALSHLILPSLTLGIVLSGFFTKTVRANMLRTVGADYVEAARARGVRERRVVYRHAFKNALVPVVTVLGLQFAVLFGGAILTETTFGWDGMGKLLYDSINSKDYMMIQGIIVFYATIIVLISVVIDVWGALIDPRIRL